MQRLKFSLLAIPLIILLFCGTYGCGDKQEPEVKTYNIRLSEVVHSIFYTPQYVALNKGFFEDENLNVELQTACGGDKAMTALLSNNADIALIGPETTIYVRQQDASKKALTFAQLTKRDGSFLVGRKPETDFDWKSLKGKTIIGARKGGMPEMVLEYILAQNGLIPQTDLTVIQNIQFTATAGAFTSGTGDYVALFEPTASMLEKENSGNIVASMGTAAGELPYTCFMAKEDYLKANPEAVQRFTNAIYRAQLWVQNHTVQEIAEAVAPSFPDIDPKLLETIIKRYKQQDTWMTTPIPNPQAFDRLQDVMENAKELKARVPYEELVTTEFAEEAVRTVKVVVEEDK